MFAPEARTRVNRRFETHRDSIDRNERLLLLSDLPTHDLKELNVMFFDVLSADTK